MNSMETPGMLTDHTLFPTAPLLLAAIAWCTLASPAAAQNAPGYIPVQGVLAADDGTPRDGSFTLEFRLYGQEPDGNAFYAESQDVLVEQGFFTAYLGDGTPADLGDGTTSPEFQLASLSERADGIVFLGVTVGEAAELSPRVQLGSVPFAAVAQYCADAATVGGQRPEDLVTRDASTLTSGTLDPARLPDLSATYAPSGHTHSPAQAGAAPAAHTHDAATLTGTLPAAAVPDLGSTYFRKDRFAWGKVDLPHGVPPGRNDGSVYNGATPKRGALTVQVPDIGCNKPLVSVTGNTGGSTNFIAWAVRDGTTDDGGREFVIDWINLYHTQGFHISFTWMAFCPDS